MNNCPCGSSDTFTNCCEPYLTGKKSAGTPETLMRSRYTAYSLADIKYIQKTMRKKAAENYDPIAARKWANRVTWLGLTIIDVSDVSNNTGTVTFIANFSDKGTRQNITEKSTFEKIEGEWFYVSGTTPRSEKHDN